MPETRQAYRWCTGTPGRLDRIVGSLFSSGSSCRLRPGPDSEPLILDDQVRASLLAPQRRADMRGNLKEYLAYREQAAHWAVSLGVTPETIEEALFEAGGEL
ncbi:MAG TPA: hypothetical protein VMZ66_06335 [Aeromicrobium sp.]|nr:hypothetical protein [Aeromicrobium sp.]